MGRYPIVRAYSLPRALKSPLPLRPTSRGERQQAVNSRCCRHNSEFEDTSDLNWKLSFNNFWTMSKLILEDATLNVQRAPNTNSRFMHEQASAEKTELFIHTMRTLF